LQGKHCSLTSIEAPQSPGARGGKRAGSQLWLVIQNTLFDHASEIENDDNGVIEDAKNQTLKAVEDWWFQGNTKEWEEHREGREEEREARGADSDKSDD